MFTITPPPAPRRWGAAACEQKSAPPKFTRRIRSVKAWSMSGRLRPEPMPLMAALFTRTSRPPRASAASSTKRRHWAASPMSTGSATTRPACLRTSGSATAGSGWPTATLAPRASRASVIARPMLVAPPVTIARIGFIAARVQGMGKGGRRKYEVLEG
jgi:hypothetical protein